MITTHNLGFPRIGPRRELKAALESYWSGEYEAEQLHSVAADLRRSNWHRQSDCDLIPVGDFSFYDQILDTSFLLGNIPARVSSEDGNALNNYFRAARGRSPVDSDNTSVRACEMTKWFDTNYHYMVPEFDAQTTFSLHADTLLAQLREAQAESVTVKPVLIGPLTYLRLGKALDASEPLNLLPKLLPVYKLLLELLAEQKIEWVQIDEPILVTELQPAWQEAFKTAYQELSGSGCKLLLTTYFGQLQDNLPLACELPIDGLHLDASNNRDEIELAAVQLSTSKILSVGVISGRNVWKTDLTTALDWLTPLYEKLWERLWLAPSCSLLHVPIDLERESEMDVEVKSWLAFAQQKLEELNCLKMALQQGRHTVQSELLSNREAVRARQQSRRVRNPDVRDRLVEIEPTMFARKQAYAQRIVLQREHLQLPLYPTTTIGSFPQTSEIRQARLAFRKGILSPEAYEKSMHKEIRHCVYEQEILGLDVLVHGEAERNDMVEYFGEQLDGFVFSRFGWVQSYGSRCVKPPILFGDILRPQPMTVEWIRYAQSLTKKPVKGMLTGPVTILNWSFVRDDQPRSETCKQLALAVRDEVLDLEASGVRIIQIDEAALREGLPLRRSQWQDYLNWSVDCFRLSANSVKDETQIHTHMCYSEFNDIIDAIARMDADVITIETSRSNMDLLEVFDVFEYPNEIGPGVYDIHTPNVPGEDHIAALMHKASRRIPAERLWVNPDCGLKTRSWREVTPALKNMVSAARALRDEVMSKQAS